MKVPFHRPSIGDDEIAEVIDTLRSGWLTTGPKAKRFEESFAVYVGAKHAVALNSATAALHLALEAIGVRKGDAVLVPTMTFAATAEVVRYFDATPILVDCCACDFNLDVEDAARKAQEAKDRGMILKAVIPVHYAGQVANIAGVNALAAAFNLRIVEDAAHCCPAHYKNLNDTVWRPVGNESDITCYSFYANKCITTGEGGMACTDDDKIADRIRIMALHGISKDAWKRFTDQGSWYYEILAPGYKYNLTDIAAAIGLHQLRQADSFRNARSRVAEAYRLLLQGISGLILPTQKIDRIHSWHLYVIRLDLARLRIDRAGIIEELKKLGIGTSVHWIPLHMHPYYREAYGYDEMDLPVAAALSHEIISLPIYPGMLSAEIEYVAEMLIMLLEKFRR